MSKKDVERRRTEAPEVRRSQILEAAKRCFRKTGFHATQMAAIAAEAQVSVGLVYRHFPNKEALIETIARQDIERQKRQFTEVVVTFAGDPKVALDEIVNALSSTIFDHDRTALMLEIAAEAMRNPRIQAFASNTQSEIVELMRTQLSPHNEMTPEEVAARLQLLGGLISGVSIQLYGQARESSALTLEILKRTAEQILAPS